MSKAVKGILSLLLSVGMVNHPLLAQTSEMFVNNGVLLIPPQVDARSVVNNGLMDFNFFQSTETQFIPFETYNTLWFTNRGTMASPAGFRLAYLPDDGSVQSASVFANTAAARIEGNDILILATNIIQKGLISAVDFTGLVRLSGENVDVSRSRIDVPTLDESFSTSQRIVRDQQGNVLGFNPEIGISDAYWQATNAGMDVARLLRLIPQGDRTNIIVQPPLHEVLPNNFRQRLDLVNASAWVLTNAPSATNQVVQAIFAVSFDTNFVMDASWQPALEPGVELSTAYLQFITTQTNVVSGSTETVGLTVIDWLGPETNAVILTNLLVGDFGRPSNYEYTIRQDSGFIRANSPIREDLFTTFYSDEFPDGEAFTNNVVTNFFTAYSGRVAEYVLTADPVPGASLTNNAGRVDIVGKNVDVSNARIRAQGGVNIIAENLVNSTNAALDVPYLNFTLGSTNGPLRVTSLSKPFVQRMGGGQIRVWSAVWTNSFQITVTNAAEESGAAFERLARLADDGGGGDTGGGTETTETIDYNTVFHVLIAECGVGTRQAVTVNEFKSLAPVTVIEDELNVSGPMRIDSEALTITGTFGLSAGFGSFFTIRDWAGTNSPNLRFLTNHGRLNVVGVQTFGGDLPQPLEAFVNSGTNTAHGSLIHSRYFENSGDLIAGFSESNVKSEFVNLNGGRLEASGSVNIETENLRIRNTVVQSSSDAVTLNVRGDLSDGGSAAASQIRSPLGIHLPTLPTAGSLLGTTVEITPIPFAEATVAWSAADRGALASGFENNAAIGRLILDAQNNSVIYLQSAGGGSAIYVDSLELGAGMLARLEEAVIARPGMKVYFAGANVPVDDLNGRLGGALEWIPDFAGPYSGMDILLPGGQVARVNRAFRESMNYDSDADGLVNGIDPSPFDGVTIEDIQVRRTDGEVVLSWEGAEGFTYVIQSSDDLVDPEWMEVGRASGPESGNGPVTVTLSLPEGSTQNYFRVTYQP